jgi:amino acid adenylation domain-containing protein
MPEPARNTKYICCIHQLFELQVERTASAIAVIEGWPSTGHRSLTYQELNTRANQLAHYLQKLGVGPETVVGIYLERSLELVVAILGALKAGAAYLPLDPDYPAGRLNFMLSDARAPVLLTRRDLAGKLEPGSLQVNCLDSDWEVIAKENPDNPLCTAAPENLAYVIYTSGSTGLPKGAMVPHRALCNHMTWMQSAFPIGPGDRVLQKTALSFDASVWEFYAPLLTGAQLVMAKPGGHRDAAYLVEAIRRENITILQVVPTVLRLLVEEPGLRQCVSLRRLFCGGEALTPDLVEKVYGALDVELVNLYGPAEACIDTLYYTVPRSSALEKIPIGRPVANTRVYILDSQLQPLPVGEVGELFLAGDSVGRGYLNQPALTAGRFLPDPMDSSGGRLYRTGDLARCLPDGNVEYLGRVDAQVKILGGRLEPGEIERLIEQYPGVRQAAVVVQEDSSASARRLVAYLALQAGVHLASEQLRQHLRRQLPDYMLPANFVFLDSLPVLPSGKLDRLALARLDLPPSNLEKSYLPPRTPLEEALVEIWSEVLRVARVGITESFFDLGGNSLVMAQILARVFERFQVELSIFSVFEKPDIAHMAAQIEQLNQVGQNLEMPPIRRVPHEGRLPLSFPQEQVWFLSALEPNSLAYNYQIAVRFEGCLDLSALEKTLTEIVRRHEIYRTTFHQVDGAPFQVIHEPAPVKVPLIDLSVLPGDQKTAEADRLMAIYLEEVFNIAQLPLVKWRLLKFSEQGHLLIHLEHHLVHDGWSFAVLLKEFQALYADYHAGRESSLEELVVQFADYAVWQRETMRGEYLESQLNYWKERLSGAPAFLSLPTDRPRPPQKSFRGASIQMHVDASLYHQTKTFSQREGVTLFTTFLTAFKALLYRYTGQTDLVIGSGFANRRLRETEALIGMLVNTIVLRTDLSGDLTFRQLLGRVSHTVLDAYMHQDIPLETLVEALQVERNLSYNPLFQVVFSFHDSPVPKLEFPGLVGSLEYKQNKSAKFDINVVVIPRAEQLLGSSESVANQDIVIVWEYDTDLFDAARMERMVEHYLALLRQMVETPDERINQVSLLSTAERELVLKQWNATQTVYPRASCVPELFEIEARRAPQALAVVLASAPDPAGNASNVSPASLTYRELNERANQLAHYLQKLGVSRQTPVGVFMERTPEMVVALLGILKAGGVYAPLDLSFPRNRLQFMIDDMHLSVLVSQGKLVQSLPVVQAHIVCLDEDWLQIAQESPADLPVQNEAMDPAYVMYTSGSTGTPKGILIPHRGIVRLVKDTNYIQIERGDRISQASNIAFDAATFEVWGALLNGASLVMLPQEVVLSPVEYARLIRRERIQVAFVTTALFNQIASIEPAAFWSVRDVLTGGEIASPAWMRDVLRAGGPQRLLNMYGPTENTTYTTWHQVVEIEDATRSIPIGRPVSNTQTYILDRWLNPLPVGIPGELYIGGDGLALGYLERPALTAERFIPDPFGEPGQRLYRTGDLAKVLPDGSIEFLGRIDQQVKLRGFRVELGEIESALIEHPAVQQAVVLLRESPSGEKFLAAYLVSRPEQIASPAELRDFLRLRLPDFMLPSAFVFMTALPLTSNGKVDRRALPEPGAVSPASDRRTPEIGSAFERVLMQIWIDTLGIEQIGLQDNFFDLGGHSLLAFRLMNRIEELFDLDLSLTILFGAPTFADFAKAVLENIVDKERVEEIARLLLELETIQDSENEAISDDQERLNPGDHGSPLDFSLM